MVTRFWLAREDESFAEGWFLPPGLYSPTKAKVFEQLADYACLALLGEPGMGKTTTLLQAYEAQGPTNAAWIDLGEFNTDTALQTELTTSRGAVEWLASDAVRTLFLDGFDEAVKSFANLGKVLVRIISGLPTDRLRIRIGCRTIDWPELLSREFRRLFPASYNECVLAPLSRENAVEIVGSLGVKDPDAFVTRLDDLDLSALANKPIAPPLLANAPAIRESAERASLAELYERGLQAQCGEPNPGHVAQGGGGGVDVSRRLDAARWIAAACLCARKVSVWTGPPTEAPSDSLSLDDLSSATGQLGERGYVDRAMLFEALSTPIFRDCGANRRTWHHATYAEYLSASWLRVLPLKALLNLLVSRDGRAPQLEHRTG